MGTAALFRHRGYAYFARFHPPARQIAQPALHPQHERQPIWRQPAVHHRPHLFRNAAGDNYYVWDKSAAIDFIKPGFGEVYLDCKLNYDDVERIRAATAGGDKYLPEFTVRLFDKNDETIALATRVIYIRLKKELRP